MHSTAPTHPDPDRALSLSSHSLFSLHAVARARCHAGPPAQPPPSLDHAGRAHPSARRPPTRILPDAAAATTIPPASPPPAHAGRRPLARGGGRRRRRRSGREEEEDDAPVSQPRPPLAPARPLPRPHQLPRRRTRRPACSSP